MLHAVLQRPHSKGRDLYDLLWYLSDPAWPAPNLTMLNKALAQTGWAGEALTEANWAAVIGRRVHEMDWRSIVADVRPFLQSTGEAGLLTRDNVLGLLERRAP